MHSISCVFGLLCALQLPVEPAGRESSPQALVAGTRIPQLPFTINQPGNYVVLRSLQNPAGNIVGITILCDDVTIDLNGQALLGSGTDVGIRNFAPNQVSAPNHNIFIKNGTLRGWNTGIQINGSGIQIERVRFVNNAEFGLFLYGGDGNRVERCLARENGATVTGQGLRSDGATLFLNNHCNKNLQVGISAGTGSELIGNLCKENGIGLGAADGCTLRNNVCNSNVYFGMTIGGGGLAEGNVCNENPVGISIAGYLGDARSKIVGNICNQNQTGIRIDSRYVWVDGNQISGNQTGLVVTSYMTKCRIVRNSASDNQINYSIPANNDVGPIGTAATATSPWANLQD